MDDYLDEKFDSAARFLPPDLFKEAKALPRSIKIIAEEFRLRAGNRPTLVLPEGDMEIGKIAVVPEDLSAVIDIATKASAHSSRETTKNGYVTVEGGHRIGLCGFAIMKDCEISGFRLLSSVNIRIAKEIRGVSHTVAPHLIDKGRYRSSLIISPPGCGKTTLLRDLLRSLSNGINSLSLRGMRCALADERSEVSAMSGGIPQLDVGKRTDIICNAPKAESIMVLLRSMNPELIAVDEITAPEDIAAIRSAANCGVKLLATAHAEDLGDLMRRRFYKEIIEMGIFEKLIVINRKSSERNYEVLDLEDIYAENNRSNNDNGCFSRSRYERSGKTAS